MALSYVSQTFHSSPYVLPLDLGLFDKVLSTKEKQFEMGAAKTQQQIDQFGALDVLKDSDRAYLNDKINNIVNSVNSLGGVDYSDMGVLNQIEGLGADIYGDNNIINAVSSTKSVRNLIGSYQKYKNDPKLSKLYSEVNEAYDMQAVNQWVNDGQVGSTYKGASSATPYVAYRDNHFKLFQNMKADLRTEITDKGLFYVNKEGEYIRPERIMQAAADLLTPQERGQMKRDGWYLYNVQGKLTPQDIVNKSLVQFDDRVAQAEGTAEEYEAMAKAATGDAKARANYNALAIKQRQEVNSLKQQRGQAAKAAIQSYQQDPDEFTYQVYSNDYFRGLANRFSINRTKTTIQKDEAEMFQKRMEQEDYQFGVTAEFKKEDLDLKEREVKVKEGHLEFEYWKEGLSRIYDPITKTYKFVQDPNDRWSPTNINTQNPDGLGVSERTLSQMNGQLEKEKNAVNLGFINQIAQLDPALTELKTSELSPTGVVAVLKGQEFLEGVNNQPGFQMEDLEGLKSNALRGQLASKGLNSKQIEFLDRLYDNYKGMRNGKPPKFKLPDGFVDSVKNITMIDERIRANNAKIQAVNSALYDGILTKEEQNLYTDYQIQGGAVKGFLNNALRGVNIANSWLTKGAVGGDTAGDFNKKIEAIQKKLDASGIDFDTKKKAYYKNLATRDVYNARVFGDDDPDIKNKEIHRFVYEEAKRLNIRSTDGKKIDLDDIDVDDIRPIVIGMTADGSGSFALRAQISQGSGDSKEYKEIQIPITDKNAQRVGMHRDPYANLNYSVNIAGKSGELPIYGGTNGLSASVRIYKNNPSDLNDYSSYAKVIYNHLDQNGQPIPGKFEEITIPSAKGRTASEAYALAETFIKKADAAKVSYQNLKQWLYDNQ